MMTGLWGRHRNRVRSWYGGYRPRAGILVVVLRRLAGDGSSDHGFRREAIVADDVHEPGDDLQIFYARAVCFRDLAGKALTDGYDVIELKTAGPTRWPKRVALGVQDIDVFSISSLSEPGNYLPISLFSSKLLLAFGCRHACTYA